MQRVYDSVINHETFVFPIVRYSNHETPMEAREEQLNSNTFVYFKRFLRIGFHCKLVPVQYGLLHLLFFLLSLKSNWQITIITDQTNKIRVVTITQSKCIFYIPYIKRIINSLDQI